MKSGYIELMRIIVAKKLDIPPDDVDMFAIFSCVQRAIEEKVENNSDEFELIPINQREIGAIIGPIGETIISMIFNGEDPFGDFAHKYGKWYKENLATGFLTMKLKTMKGD
jgi:hypothetical protein